MSSRSLKDTKRRVLQSANEALDPTAKTVDPEYDIHATKFPEVRLLIIISVCVLICGCR